MSASVSPLSSTSASPSPLAAGEVAPDAMVDAEQTPSPLRRAWSFTRRLPNLARHGGGQLCLLARALGVVIVVRLGLSLWSYRGLREHLPRWFARGNAQLSPDQALEFGRKVSWAVSRAASVVPAASCLTQAFAAQMMLARAGEASRLHIGVARDPKTNAFQAHAWIEHRERIIVGGTRRELARYTPITSFDS